MESPTPQPAPGSATFMEGCKDSLPIVISYIPVAFAFGLNATRLGFSPLESVFFSCIIYAGASQFVSSFTPIEQMLKFRASRHEDFPYQEILLTRLCMHMQSKLLENRNKMLKAQGINETLFMALITLESQENHSIQPSELSCALGSSRTNATRIADELEKRGWIERRESDNDRRCLHLQLTEKGHEFLREVLPPQHNCLHQLWSALSTTEKDQLEQITRKLLSRLDQMEQDGVVLEAMS